MRLYCHFGALAALSACVGGFACRLCLVALTTKNLQVRVIVIPSTALVVDVVNVMRAISVTAVSADGTITG